MTRKEAKQDAISYVQRAIHNGRDLRRVYEHALEMAEEFGLLSLTAGIKAGRLCCSGMVFDSLAYQDERERWEMAARFWEEVASEVR